MKRFLKSNFLIAIVVITVLLLTACGSNNSKNDNTNNANVDFPEKDLKVIVPFGPGGAVDTINRIIANNADEYINDNSMVIENKEGGGAVLGQTEVANAQPDGYTLLAYTSSVVGNSLTEDTSFEYTDFAPVAMYSFEPELLVVPEDSELDSFDKFEKKAKESEIKLATPGHSTSHHIAGILLEQDYDWNFDFVHTESAGEQTQQLLGGHVEAALLTYGEVQSQIDDGSIVPLAVMSDDRLEEDTLKDVPTFKEKDIEMVYGPFRGVAVPKDTPDETVDKLEDAYQAIIDDEDFQNEMNDSGFELVQGDANDLKERSETEAEYIEKVLPELQE